MRIAVLAHIRHPIAEPFEGGMEAHCHSLCRALRTAGHDVTLFAADGTDDPQLVPICAAPYERVLPFAQWQGTATLGAYQHRAFAKAFDYLLDGDFDIVHNNSLFAPIVGWCADAGLPCVTSQHVPPFEDMRRVITACIDEPAIEVTVTSNDQRRLWPAAYRKQLITVHNGIDTNLWRPFTGTSNHFTWAGRIAPNKGTALAARAARRAGVELKIYGPIEDPEYFAQEVEPWFGESITDHGHLPAERLRSAIAESRGALVTPMWDEPFGLVAAEALSCGTPVIGFDRGALAEVVGACGRLVPGGDVDRLAAAIAQVDRIDRGACRRRAVEHFSIKAMIAGYEACYASAIAGADTAGSPRATRSSIRSRAFEALA